MPHILIFMWAPLCYAKMERYTPAVILKINLILRAFVRNGLLLPPLFPKGKGVFSAIAVAGGDVPITPCGICRQALAEFGDMEVICSSAQKDFFSISLKELLPHGFCLADAQAKR